MESKIENKKSLIFKNKLTSKPTLIKLLFLFLILLLLISAFYNGMVIRNYTLYTDKIYKGESAKFVVISDLHNNVFGEEQQTLIKKIKEQKPDAIFLTGDLLDEDAYDAGTRFLLKGINKICPIYYVTGNHEFWYDIKHVREIINEYEITILSDNYEEILIKGNPFVICGIEDPVRPYYEDRNYNQEISMFENFSVLESIDGYKILLAHRPEEIDLYKNFDFDLVVSGHTHGGQVIIPFILNGLYAPNQGIFPKYAGGLYEHEDTKVKHIVSRGLSVNPKLPRIFNPPELVVIDIIGS